MRGIIDENRPAFKEAREKLRDMKHNVFCPSEFTDTRKELKLSTDLRGMMYCDVAWICNEAEGVVCLPGWASSKGAMAEVHLAWAIGIPVYEYELFHRRIIREVKGVPGFDA